MMAEHFRECRCEDLCVADLTVRLWYASERMGRKIQSYIIPKVQNPDIEIEYDGERIRKFCEKNPEVPEDSAEYIISGDIFYKRLLKYYNGFMLHSSCVACDGRAYLFSAPCGTGKSTHVSLWLKYLGERAVILNDDKPALRVSDDGSITAYGTPWSGKTDFNVNMAVPVGGIAFIERASENSIEKMSSASAVTSIISQTIRPRMEQNIDKLISVIDAIASSVPIYTLRCNMDIEAAKVAFEEMSKN